MMPTLLESARVDSQWADPTLNWIRAHRHDDLLQKWGLQEATTVEHLALDTWVCLLQEIEENGGNLLSLGMLTAAHLISVHQIRHLLRGLHLLQRLYRHDYPKAEAGLGYRLGAADENTLMLSSQTPYPDAFEYGLIYGMADACRQEGQAVNVNQFHSLPCLKQYSTRTYVIHLTPAHDD